MKKLIVVGSGAIGALAVSALLGGGVAAADDYAGQKYSDASSAAGEAGQTVVIAARTGDKLDQGDCIVERSQTAPFSSANDGKHVDKTVQFYLNCNGGYATATTPGTSLGKPGGPSREGGGRRGGGRRGRGRAQRVISGLTPG